MTTLTMKGRRYVLVPEKEYLKLLKELSIIEKEDAVLAKEMQGLKGDEYVDVESFKKQLKERISKLKRKKGK